METGKYIFYTFDTLTWQHIALALDSIRRQSFRPMHFVLYNNSSTFNSEVLLAWAKAKLGRQFESYSVLGHYPDTHSTLVDIQYQLVFLDGADFYFLHKADFYLGAGVVQRAIDRYTLQPFFVNFCKFDLRETITSPAVLSTLSFEEVLRLDGACDLTEGVPDDWGIKYDKIGYRGWDGVMHFYNEAARRLIHMDTFCEERTVAANRQNGIKWDYGDPAFLAFHLFHALPHGRGDANKDIPGFRY